MYLIDSSVWIEYFRAKGSAVAKRRVREILKNEEALCCGVVVVEILRGARDEKDFSTLKDSLLFLPQLPILLRFPPFPYLLPSGFSVLVC